MKTKHLLIALLAILITCFFFGCVDFEAERTDRTQAQVTTNIFSFSQLETNEEVATTETVESTTKATEVTTKATEVTTKATEVTTKTTEVTTKTTTKTETMVWIPQSGSKYHSRSGCSNMKNPSQVTLSKAQNLGFSPCSKCY